MQMIDAQRVHELLDYPGLIKALREAHLGDMPKMSDRIIYHEENAEGPPDSPRAFAIIAPDGCHLNLGKLGKN